MSRFLFICLVLLVSASLCIAQDSKDIPGREAVKFLVLGKTANHRQVTEGVYALLNYHFFAEIFLEENRAVTEAKLLLSQDDGESMLFGGNPPVLEVHGGRYTSEEELNKAYPDGEYVFSYTLANGETIEQAVDIRNSSDKTRISFPVVIYLSQDGELVGTSSIDPDKDLDISWSTFESGNADSNNISDDLIFAVTGDCHGAKIDHSGVPFGQGPHLTFSSQQHTIPATKLYPGESFQVFVEHAEMDTSKHNNSTARIATYAATTFLDFKTIGERLLERAPCPEIMPAMDGGQTDRPTLKKMDFE